MSSLDRIKKEAINIKKEPLYNCTARPISKDFLTWSATIIGPEDTPYYNGVFNLKIDLSENYPFKPPKIRFKTKIYHPNIDSSGAICLDILKHEWSPALTISKILLSICSLLASPNPEDPLVPYIANLYKKNIKKYKEEAKNYTIAYASGLK